MSGEKLVELADDDLAGILIRAAEFEEGAALLHRTAIADGLTDEVDVPRWCEKKARAFRRSADLIEQLQARLAEAEGVVRPFAEIGTRFDAPGTEHWDDAEWVDYEIAPLQFGHFRAAASWLAGR